MHPLIQPVVDLLSLASIVFALTMAPLLIAAMLVRQLGWFGFNTSTNED